MRTWIIIYWKKWKIEKENKKLSVSATQLSALESWLVYIWCISVTDLPSYATTSVALILIVSTRWQEIFTDVYSQAKKYEKKDNFLAFSAKKIPNKKIENDIN